MPAKAIWQSKTVWLNAIAVLVVLVNALTDAHLFTDPRAVSVFGIVLAVLNALLRVFATDRPVSLAAPPRSH